ncbi:S-methyl-5-thioribose-1-phosphate isomerase [Rosistilla oblonga]|uniref:S-methyl-5-thioribose-1-phosphate isomerase n=1 Tax=Rosistilla oblonga TaxID=2527990 RepID=UPI003A96AE5B
MSTPAKIEPLSWQQETSGYLRLIDQTRLPTELVEIDCRSVEQVWTAIKRLSVRGAPAIGVAAAYGVCIGAAETTRQSVDQAKQQAHAAADYLATSRPTAVNLFWALDRMRKVIDRDGFGKTDAFLEALLAEARAIHQQDRETCHSIGRHGAPLIAAAKNVLTHCNAGALATAEYGTALAVIYSAHDSGQTLHVFADETRPLLQGARLTAWELQQHGVPVTVICDSMAACVMKEGRVDAVIVGADRIAANGDACNKIGTYGLSVLAKHHNIPFYVAAPCSTFDLSLASGDLIPIEQRAAYEIAEAFGKRTVPEGVEVYNPAFDVAPAELITAIITDRGVIDPVDEANVRRVVQDAN